MSERADCTEHIPLLRWASHGTPLFGVLLWSPILLIDPFRHAYVNNVAWPVWVGLGLIAVTNVSAIVGGTRRSRRRLCESLFAVQAAATIVLTGSDVDSWYALYQLLVIGASAAVRARLVPTVVLGTTMLWVGLNQYAGTPWSDLWISTAGLLLAGVATFVFCQLFVVVAELNATRDALARAAVSTERERFSRDLHDVLGHTLSLIVVKAQAARRLLPEQTEAAATQAAEIETIGRHALEDVRATVRGYRETTFETEVERARDALRTGDVELSLDASAGAVAPAQDALLGWVVREATTNVIRHSDGTRCTIALRRLADRLELRISDDGQTHSSHGANGGSGLAGLSERITTAGGGFDAGPSEHGFVVTASLPLTRNPGAA